MTTIELEFLPAALEIQETPPLPMSRYILWGIMLFFSIAIAWANVSEVDIVGIAQGKIVPGSRVKVIQPLETGVIHGIFVTEGEYVSEGQRLIELDTTTTGADRDQLKNQQLALKLERARLLSLLDSLHDDQEPMTNDNGQVTNNHFTNVIDATPEQIQLQKHRMQSRLREYQAQLAALVEEGRQRQAEYGAITRRIEQLDATIPLISERVASLKDLLDKDLFPRVQYLELEQERIQQVKERDIQREHLASTAAAMAGIEKQRNAYRAEFETQLLNELSELEQRITAIDQELIKADQRITLQKLVSPVAGSVHQLSTHTIGGVVTPAQELMHIVPEEGALEIEAWLPNKDIGFVHEGQAAEIKVETFPFTRYGTLAGEIIQVSNDATADERLGLVYATRVKLAKTAMRIDERLINLSPGMAVTVEVKMGTRKLIEFLLGPLLRYKDESLRER